MTSLFPNTKYQISLEGFYPNGLSTRPATLEVATISIANLPHLVVNSMPRSTRIQIQFGIELDSDGEFPTSVIVTVSDEKDNFLTDYEMEMFPKSDSICNQERPSET